MRPLVPYWHHFVVPFPLVIGLKSNHNAMAQNKVCIIGALGCVGLAVWVAMEYRAVTALKNENAALHESAAAVTDLQAANEQLSNRLAKADVPGTGQAELLRLRAEVATLRRQTNELERLRAENLRLRDSLTHAGSAAAQPASEPDPAIDPVRAMAIAKMNDVRALCLAAIQFASEHKNAFPTAAEQVAPYLQKNLQQGNAQYSGTNDFDLVLPPGAKLDRPSDTIVFRGQQPWQAANGKWANAYGFLDGHAEIHAEPDLNALQAWEQTRMATTSPVAQ